MFEETNLDDKITMKRNTFYVLSGLIALCEVAIFWLSVELHNPHFIEAAFILGVAVIYLAKRRVTEIVEDERTSLITQKASERTFQIFWVLFFTLSLGSAVMVFGERVGLPPPPSFRHTPELGVANFNPLGYFAIIQMGLLCLMILLYVGFRMYYARQYGDWERDEE